MTLTDRFRAHLLAAGRAPRTASLYAGAVWGLAWQKRRRPDPKWIAGVTGAQVREWVDAAAGLGTRRLRLAALRAFFGWAVAEGLRKTDLTRGLSVSARPAGRAPVYARAQDRLARFPAGCVGTGHPKADAMPATDGGDWS